MNDSKAIMSGRLFSPKCVDHWIASAPASLSPLFMWHRLAFIAVATGLLGFAIGGAVINPLDTPILAGIVILLLGVPHGAFDVAIWSAQTGGSGRRSIATMLLQYIALASGFFCLWLLVPALALPVFIAISIYHFSGDWTRDLDIVPRLIVAGAIISAPAGLHRAEVVEIFAWLSSDSIATTFGMALGMVAVPLLQASVVVIAVAAFRSPWAAAEIAVVLALAWAMPPLMFFLIYFCGLHAIRHVIETRDALGRPSAWELAILTFPYAPLAMIGTLIGATTLSTLPPGPALVGAIFIALGSLTVPHILIVDRTDT